MIGKEKAYPTVCNTSAVALCLNLARVARERPGTYQAFFGLPIPEEELRPRPISDADCGYFGEMVDPSFCIAPAFCVDELSRTTGEPAEHPEAPGPGPRSDDWRKPLDCGAPC